MTQMQVEKLEAGASQICRKPDGYPCKVMVMDREHRKVKIYDPHANSIFWCNFDTLIKNWRMPAGKKVLK